MAKSLMNFRDSASLAPVVLLKGSEIFFADRAFSQLIAQAYQQDPQLERTDVVAAAYQDGQLSQWTSPSLFGESRLIVIKELETMTEGLQRDLIDYVKSPAERVWLVMHLSSAQRGKKLVEAITHAKMPVIACDPLKGDDQKINLIMTVTRAEQARVEVSAAKALVDAWGDDLSTLMGSLKQLLADVPGTISEADVRRYFAGRNEVTGFEVADAAIAGNSAQALMRLRHALATGVDPIPIVAALALKLRQLAKATLASAGSRNASKLGMQAWQLSKAQRELRGWSHDRLAAAIQAVALADEETKGLSKDPARAVEKAIITVCQMRGSAR